MGVNAVQNYSNDITEKAVRICRAYLPGIWKKITNNDVEVKRISGGLSNWLYHVKLLKPANAESCPHEVLLRLYGQSHGECGIQHLITESVIFALLSERKLGPRLHGVFTGGRIEEYIPARPLRLDELRNMKMSMLIAGKMAAIHSLNLPLSKEPTWLWETSTRWLNQTGDMNTIDYKNPKLKSLLKRDLYSELKWLRSYLSELGSSVVFCHNDMQEGNILIKTNTVEQNENDHSDQLCQNITSDSLLIIDYEYCAYNYRSFEIANHFIEWIFDYKVLDHPYFTVHKNNYPATHQQTAFVKHYLSKLGCKESVEKVLEEVKHFTLASHFFWVVWSLINGKSSEITFGYEEYAAERLQMYYTLKSQLLNEGSGTKSSSRIISSC